MTATIPVEALVREKANRKMQELAELAPTNLAAHAALMHTTNLGRPIVPARHHTEWVQYAHDIANYRWLVIICPPGYAKSTWWSVIYPTWRIGQERGRIRIGLISNTANLTYGFSREIMRAIADPRFEAVYGIKPNVNRWSQAQFWTTGAVDEKNPNVFAAGIGGPVQGMRFDEIICDDLTTWDDARSDLTMENQRLFVTGTLIKRFEPGMGPPHGGGRCVVVMTRWGERDLVPLFAEMGFKVITMPALGYWDRVETGAGTYIWGEEPLWPEQESREMLEYMRDENPFTFELVMQGNPKVAGGDVFETERITPALMDAEPIEFRQRFEEVVQYVDTAGGKERVKGDYFAEATVGVTDEGVVWVLDMDRGRYPAPEQEARVIVNADKWQPNLVLIEDRNEGIALYQRLIENTRLPLKAFAPQKDKEFRAIPFANAVNTGKVRVPASESDGKLVSHRWVRPFIMELDSFPRGANDDQVDAASGAYAHLGNSGPRLRVLAAPSIGGRRRRW